MAMVYNSTDNLIFGNSEAPNLCSMSVQMREVYYCNVSIYCNTSYTININRIVTMNLILQVWTQYPRKTE